jgi:chemotaxis family two-component system response regulator Rcp1
VDALVKKNDVVGTIFLVDNLSNRYMANTPRFVIADDDLSDRYLIKTAFEEAKIDVEITEFEDGAELIDFLDDGFKTNRPCFILLDLNMPKKSGMDVLEYINGNPGVCDVPVIVLSTSSNVADIKKSKELGAADYIVKPNDYLGYIDIVNALNQYLVNCSG